MQCVMQELITELPAGTAHPGGSGFASNQPAEASKNHFSYHYVTCIFAVQFAAPHAQS